MFELVKLYEELKEVCGFGKTINTSLIIKQGRLIFKLYRRSIMPNKQLLEMNDLLENYKLRIGTVRAVSDGVLSSEVGLEIHLIYIE